MRNVRNQDTELQEIIVGLIIESVNQTYCRVGMFLHQIGSASEPTKYPKFENSDPSNYERHAITII